MHLLCRSRSLDEEAFDVHRLEKTENVLSDSVGGKQNLHLHLPWCASVRKISHVR